METRRILVTGGAGFMGRWVCKTLVDKGHDIYCIDDLSGGSLENIVEFKDKLANFYQVDLADSSTKEIITDIKPEIIFYLAASAREGASFFDPVKMTRTNYMAYINTLESAIKCRLDKMVLFSSMAVYGHGNYNPPFSEDMKRSPVDIYGINKVAMERTTELLSDVHNFKYVIIRPHNVFGQYQSLTDKYRNVIAIFMNKIMRKEPIYIYGDGNQIRSFSYIEDSLNCYIETMKDKANGKIVNIGGKNSVTINRLVELVCKAMDVDYNTYPIEHLSDRYSEVKIAYATWEKSEQLLGYKEDIGYERGIKRMADWVKGIGPKEWTEERLALWNDKAPTWWK